MNEFQNDIKYFLNLYANFLKDSGEKIAREELKKAYKNEYLPKGRPNNLTLLFTHFYGTAALITSTRFVDDLIRWHKWNGTKFTTKCMFNTSRAEDKNPRENCPYANEPGEKVYISPINRPGYVRPIKKKTEEEKFDDFLDDIDSTTGVIF